MHFLRTWGALMGVLLTSSGLCAAELTRAEVIAVARSFAELQWEGGEANTRNGPDRMGIVVITPSISAGGETRPGYWVTGQLNTGVPYKWGGFDSLGSFKAGISAGKAGGDLYNPGKRVKGDAAVSEEAVGVDCSGFISRCWKLAKKYGTSMLPALCTTLSSPAELRAGDVMNYPGGHVVLFYRWLDDSHDRAEFYESEPYSKVLLSEHSAQQLADNGFKPLRYRKIKD